ncbi:MAG: glutamate synthase subunit alpha, partial [Alphaproteobacteria bacterium]|nr:glutamate synthase subunit alpha [Alphaproteobacteria bacterium]
KAKGLDVSRVLHRPDAGPGVATYNCETQDHGLAGALDHQFIAKAANAINCGQPCVIDVVLRNTNRTVGAMLSGIVAKKYGHRGLPDDTITIKAKGTAGQSFGAFLAHGVTLELVGDANDYVGKGLSGGCIIIYPPPNSRRVAEDNILIGNTVLYGAIAGECYFRGVAGERFAVRNSGATTVVEGVGDHCCEYMTGGTVVVLGRTGRNFAAGMSGGVAYVLDEDGEFERRCNLSMVELQPVTEEERALDQNGHQRGDLEAHGLVDVMHDMTRFDAQRLRLLIENHVKYTNSSRGRQILADWNSYLRRFVKVMPVDYRRALEEMRAKTEAQALAQQLAQGRHPLSLAMGY